MSYLLILIYYFHNSFTDTSKASTNSVTYFICCMFFPSPLTLNLHKCAQYDIFGFPRFFQVLLSWPFFDVYFSSAISSLFHIPYQIPVEIRLLQPSWRVDLDLCILMADEKAAVVVPVVIIFNVCNLWWEGWWIWKAISISRSSSFYSTT